MSKSLKWDPTAKRLSVFRTDSNETNGLYFDPRDRLSCCEEGARRVTRTDMKTGKIEVLVDSFDGKRKRPRRQDSSKSIASPFGGLEQNRRRAMLLLLARSAAGRCRVPRVVGAAWKPARTAASTSMGRHDKVLATFQCHERRLVASSQSMYIVQEKP